MKPSLLNWDVLSTDYQIVLVWQSRALTLAANGWQNICITDCECRKQITKNKANIYVFAKCLLTQSGQDPWRWQDADVLSYLPFWSSGQLTKFFVPTNSKHKYRHKNSPNVSMSFWCWLVACKLNKCNVNTVTYIWATRRHVRKRTKDFRAKQEA